MYYFIALAVPPLVLLVGRKWLARARGATTLALISMLGMYVVIVGTAQVHSSILERRLESFDRDRDGIMSRLEQTPEQSITMERLVNDAGRNMTVFLAAPWAVFISTVFFMLAFFAGRHLAHRSSERPSAPAELSGDR